MIRFIALFFAVLIPTIASAWSETGHHVIAVLAYNGMDSESRSKMMEILSHHPDFETTFKPPANVTTKAGIEKWQIGVAGCWPDIIRRTDEDRPTWHYELGATLVIGNVEVDDRPGPLPADATMDTQELYLSQAVELALKTYRDESVAKADRAIALCWILHLYADGHQPCHAGSLYAPCFDGHDRGANSIRFTDRGNLHSAWDGLLGRRATASDVLRRVAKLGNPLVVLRTVADEAGPDWLTPSVWLTESRKFGLSHVYTDEVRRPVIAASRGLTDGLPKFNLSEEYFQAAGKVARERVKYSATRLAIVLGK
ncbi:MAG: S1/P1 nuclease [Planctomycetota bacterium]